jgi:hypothetical protein
MDNRKKVFKHGGRLRIVPGLFEITAIYVHYLKGTLKQSYLITLFILFIR